MPEVAEVPASQKAPPVWKLGADAVPSTEPVVTSKEESQVETPPEVEKPPEERREMLEKVPEKKSPDKEINFQKVRESLKQKEQEIAERDARIKAFEEQEAARKSADEATQTRIRELEQKLSTANPEDFTAKEQKYQQELEAIRGELKLVALERDPDFINQFDKPRQLLHGTLQELAVTSGVTPEDFQRALRFGQEDQLENIRESLTPSLQRKWDAALTQIEQVNLQREMALKDKETTYDTITKKRQAEHQSQVQASFQQRINLAKQAASEPFEKIEALRGNEQLRQEIEQDLIALAGGEGAERYPMDAIFREFAASRVQRLVLQNQTQAIQAKDARIAELEEAVKKHESFIQEKYGSLPSNETSAAEKKEPAKQRAIWEEVRDDMNNKRGAFI